MTLFLILMCLLVAAFVALQINDQRITNQPIADAVALNRSMRVQHWVDAAMAAYLMGDAAESKRLLRLAAKAKAA